MKAKRNVVTFMAALMAIVLLLPASGFADLVPVSSETALSAARNWLRYSGEMQWGPSALNSEPVMQGLWHDGQAVGYVAMIEGGFVVLPAYRELPPVTAYSFTSTFDPGDEGGFVAMIKELLAEKIAVAQEVADVPVVAPDRMEAAAQVTRDRELWESYAGTYAEFLRAVEEATPRRALDDTMDIGPLLQTAWRQSTPYNNFCPMGDGGRTVTGCVATAAAQILFYWQSANCGTGSRTYTWNGDQSCGGSTPSQSLSATFSDGYDWANMLPIYISGYTQAQADAVAELNYEVGVALGMDYGRCASGSSTSLVASILPQYFGMASGINVQYRSSYATAAAWFAMLQADLNAGRPMQYRIQSHSIVCDGWRLYGGNQVHMNYGWGNSYTAWYTVDALYCPWSGCGPSAEYVVRNIQPAGAPPAPSLTVTAPNGGENFFINGTYAINWSSSSLPENVTIEMNRSFPAGAWETIAANTANDGTEPWTVSGEPSTSVRIRIRGAATPAVGDTSNANFTVQPVPPTPAITVTAPNGGETWSIGATQTVSWNSEHVSGNVAVELNRRYPNGAWVTLAANAPNSGSWTWTVSGEATARARIRVRALSNAASDVSNANFSIVSPPPTITVISPNGGEVLALNSTQLITWSSTGLSGNVKIQINRNYPAGSWQNIANNTPNDGEHLWTVSGAATSNARIRISSGSSVSDVSDGNFQIATGDFAYGAVPELTGLQSVYPNPFNPVTQIHYQMAVAGHVRVDVFDPTGRLVEVLVDGERPAGRQTVAFDGRGLGAGIYFVRFHSGAVQNLQKVYLLK